MNKDTPASRLRALIELNGIKKKDFAQLTDVTANTLSKILNERQPLSKAYAANAANILNVSPEYLLCQTDAPRRNFQYEEFINQSSQTRKMRAITEYLKSLGIYVEHQIKIGHNFFRETEEGFSSMSEPTKIYSEEEIIKEIKNSDTDSCSYTTTIEYKTFSKVIPHKDFMYIINNFHRLAQSHFSMLLQSFDDPSVITFPNEIDKLLDERSN